MPAIDSEDRSRLAKRRRRVLSLVLVLVGCALAGEGFLLVGEHAARQLEDAPKPKREVPGVRTLRVAPEDVPVDVEATGFLESPATVLISSEVAGVLREKLPSEGAAVREGDLVAVIDEELARIRLEGARSREASWQVRLEYLRKETERSRRLLETDSIGASELDRLLSETRRAEAALEEARSTSREADVSLRKCRIRAPREGVWFEDLARAGEYLRPGQAIGRLRVVDPLELEVEVSGKVRLRLAKGQPVAVEILDDEDDTGAARVVDGCQISRMPPGANPATGRFPVVISVADPERRLLPGLFARARLRLPRSRSLLLVPKPAVFDRLGQSALYVVEESEGRTVARERFIEVRSIDDRPTRWVVTSGLKAGDAVIVSPVDPIRPGREVRVEEGP